MYLEGAYIVQLKILYFRQTIYILIKRYLDKEMWNNSRVKLTTSHYTQCLINATQNRINNRKHKYNYKHNQFNLQKVYRAVSISVIIKPRFKAIYVNII